MRMWSLVLGMRETTPRIISQLMGRSVLDNAPLSEIKESGSSLQMKLVVPSYSAGLLFSSPARPDMMLISAPKEGRACCGISQGQALNRIGAQM